MENKTSDIAKNIVDTYLSNMKKVVGNKMMEGMVIAGLETEIELALDRERNKSSSKNMEAKPK